MEEKDDKDEENNKIIEEEVEEVEEIRETKKTIDEGFSQLIDSYYEMIYCLVDNTDKEKNKLFINMNLQDSISQDENISIYTDSECKNLFQELKPSKGLNVNYTFDILEGQEFYMKSSINKELFFYYKYCTEKDLEGINISKKDLKVKCKENKNNKLKISFNSPYTKGTKFNTKYLIYISDDKKEKYNIFKEVKVKEVKSVEGNEYKYEVELDIDPSKKDQFIYVVAEPKDSNVNIRPKIFYKGEKILEPGNKSETIIYFILIILIIIIFFYKFMKKKRLAQQKKESNAFSNLTNEL